MGEHLGKQNLLFLLVQFRMKPNETALRAGRTNTGQSKGQELRERVCDAGRKCFANSLQGGVEAVVIEKEGSR